MAAGWYVLGTYSGYENKIEKTLRLMMESGDLSKEAVRDIRIPHEDVVEIGKDGKKRTKTRNTLPGYILIEMDLPDEPMLWKQTVSRIVRLDGVSGFASTPRDKKPRHISAEEARAFLQKSGETKSDRPVRSRQMFAKGEQVKITEGPFESFTGTIDEVNEEKNKLKVSVQIFGRNTPVEVDVLQVEKI